MGAEARSACSGAHRSRELGGAAARGGIPRPDGEPGVIWTDEPSCASASVGRPCWPANRSSGATRPPRSPSQGRSEEHTSELQSLMRISYAVFRLHKKKINNRT